MATIRPGNGRIGLEGGQQRVQPVGIGGGRVLGQKHQIVAPRVACGQIAGFAVAELLGRDPYDAHRVGRKNGQGVVARTGIHRNDFSQLKAAPLLTDTVQHFGQIARAVFCDQKNGETRAGVVIPGSADRYIGFLQWRG